MTRPPPRPYEFAVEPSAPATEAHVFKTRSGWIGLIARGDVLCRTLLPSPSKERLLEAVRLAELDAAATPPPKALASVVEVLIAYFDGAKVDPAAVPARFDPGPISEFSLKVYRELRTVKRGETCTYGRLAARIGLSGSARAVGAAMRRNRFPLLVPCHRVLASGGAVGGFSSPGGIADKEALLRLES